MCALQVWSIALFSNERRLVTVSGDREMRIFQIQSHGVEVRASLGTGVCVTCGGVLCASV